MPSDREAADPGPPQPKNGSDAEASTLRERLQNLAAEKAYLQLVVRLMDRMSARPGLNEVVASMLQGVVEVIGGTDAVLYFRIGDEYGRHDLGGSRTRVPAVEDADVRAVFEQGQPRELVQEFSRTLMNTPEFARACTWIHPLKVGAEVVGVLRLEDLHVGMQQFRGDLSTFFSHAALVLKNAIVEHSRLAETVERLRRANQQLSREIESRRQAQEALEGLKAGLEGLVLERTTELRQATERYRTFFDHGPDGVVLVDPATTRIVEFNDQACRQLGYTREEFAGLSVMDLEASESAEETRSHVAKVMREGIDDFETLQRTRSGEIRNIHVTAQYLRLAAGNVYHSVWRDITERRKAEEALRESEAHHRALFETVLHGVVYQDAEGAIVSANPAAERILGLTLEQMQGRSSMDPRWRAIREDGSPFPGEEHPAVVALRTGKAVDSAVMGVFNPAREAVSWVEGNAVPLFRPGADRPFRVYTIFQDITARRQSEESLRQALAQNRALYEAIPDLIFLNRSDGEFLAVHSPSPDQLYAPVEAFLHRKVTEVLPAPLGERFLRAYRDALDSQSVQEVTYTLPVRGREGHFEARIVPCGQDVVLSMVRDISGRVAAEQERRSLEAQLQHLQRLESVGRLAGGIAHDMNNVLAAIMSVASLAQGGGEDADIILQACLRGRDLIKGLMEFSRKEIQDAELLDLNQLVKQETELLSSTTLQKVRIRTELDVGLPRLVGSASALSTALMNLCVNAIDAMPQGGTLTIRTSLFGDRSARLSVEDTGHGMPPEVLARAMEPFFTTKPVGKGTGLGLSRVFGTVQAHGGTMEIQSRPGEGTRVQITLPLVLGERRQRPRPETPAPQPRTTRRILLVDDDPLVRASCPPLLQRLGHQVAVASSGYEALGMIEHGAECDVVLLDQNMPGLDGLETLGQMRQSRPSLPVILATGFVDSTSRERFEGLGHVFLLNKPFTPEEFEQVLTSAMAQREPVTDDQH